MRRILVLTLTCAALGTLSLPARADSGSSDIVDRYSRLEASGLVTLTPDGLTHTTGVAGVETVVNAAGRILDRLPFKATVTDRPLGQTIARTPCVEDTKGREGFTAYLPPVVYSVDKKNEKGSFQYAEPNVTGEVDRFDPATGTTTLVTAGPTVTGAHWGPDGQIVVLRREPSGPRLDVVAADGTRKEIDPGVPDVGNTPWGKSGWIAMAVFTTVGQPPTATLFVKPATGQRSTLDGWLPLAWSPSGEDLLVRDAAKGTTLAVVNTADLTKTHNVGLSDAGTVWDAVWLPST